VPVTGSPEQARARNVAALLVLQLALASSAALAQTPDHLLDDVKYLSADRLAGRMTGTPGADSAAHYIARRFAESGLTRPAGGWLQDFAISVGSPAAHHAGVGELRGSNVVGILRGRDPTLRSEAVVVGAHYDHLGMGGPFALDPDSVGVVHNGADDNASGVAALLAIAQSLAAKPPARTLIFVAFAGEELGLLGSAYYVKHPVVPMAQTVAMVNLDMVGRLRNNRLIVYGTATAKEFPALLDSLDRIAGFDLKAQGDGFGPSDQSSFYAAGKPVLHFFTDLHEDYHRSTDDWPKINAQGLRQVADFAAAAVVALANRREPLTFVNAPVTAHRGVPALTPGYGAYLGTVPDMTDTPGGVRLSAVRSGSPAEQAGLRGDDIITRIGDMDVPDLQAMTDALRAHKPGDVVDIVIRRGDSTATVRATLGRRS
jgi:Zn-dependent M28 family amino/carboxypeptidase